MSGQYGQGPAEEYRAPEIECGPDEVPITRGGSQFEAPTVVGCKKRSNVNAEKRAKLKVEYAPIDSEDARLIDYLYKYFSSDPDKYEEQFKAAQTILKSGVEYDGTTDFTEKKAKVPSIEYFLVDNDFDARAAYSTVPKISDAYKHTTQKFWDEEILSIIEDIKRQLAAYAEKAKRNIAAAEEKKRKNREKADEDSRISSARANLQKIVKVIEAFKNELRLRKEKPYNTTQVVLRKSEFTENQNSVMSNIFAIDTSKTGSTAEEIDNLRIQLHNQFLKLLKVGKAEFEGSKYERIKRLFVTGTTKDKTLLPSLNTLPALIAEAARAQSGGRRKTNRKTRRRKSHRRRRHTRK